MSETGGQQIAFGDALDPFPAWTSLERSLGIRVSGWRINRGRVDETQRTGTGAASIFVNDLSGYLGAGSDFPTHARLLLRGSPRFRGHVDEIAVEEDPSPAGVSRVTIECVDLFDYLSTCELVPGTDGDVPPAGQEQYVYFPVQQVDDRIIAVLDGVGVLSGQREIFSGNVEVMASTYSAGTTAMQVLDEAADAEWPGVSNRFVTSKGKYAFRGRFARFNPEAYPQINFWEAETRSTSATGRAAIRALQWTRGRKMVTNTATAWVRGADEADIPLITVEDATSIGTYGRRSWSAENLLTKRHLSDGTTGADQAVLFSTYQVANYKQAEPRVQRVRFLALRDDHPAGAATWDLMQNIEISDVLDLYTGSISGRYFVEGITMEARELDGDIPYVICDLDLSPAAWWTTDPF